MTGATQKLAIALTLTIVPFRKNMAIRHDPKHFVSEALLAHELQVTPGIALNLVEKR